MSKIWETFVYADLSRFDLRSSTRAEPMEQRYNPFVRSVVRRAQALWASGLPSSNMSMRRRTELESLVRASIDHIAACHAAGLSPQERDAALADVLNGHKTLMISPNYASRPKNWRARFIELWRSLADAGPSSCDASGRHL